MAVFTSTSSGARPTAGNWDVGGGRYPGDGVDATDTMICNHAITDDEEMDIANMTGGIVIQGSGSYTLTTAGSPISLLLSSTCSVATFSTIGTQTAKITTTSAGTTTITGNKVCEWTDFGTGIGNAGTDATSGDGDFDFQNCIFDGTGQMDMSILPSTSNLRFNRCTIKNNLNASYAIRFRANDPDTTEYREIKGSSFACVPYFYGTNIGSFELENNYFEEPWLTEAAETVTTLKDTAFYGVDHRRAPATHVDGGLSWYDEQDNPHPMGCFADITQLWEGFIFYQTTQWINDQGDCIRAATGTGDYTYRNCIVCLSGAGDSSGTFISMLAPTGQTHTIENNTMIEAAVRIGETLAGEAGTIPIFRNNLAIGASTPGDLGVLLAEAGPGPAANYVTRVGYNGYYGLRTPRYDVAAGTIATDDSANDVTGDPQLVEGATPRDPTSYMETVWSIAGTKLQQSAALRTAFTERNDPDSVYFGMAVSDVTDWIKAGKVPENLDYEDGDPTASQTFIGAMQPAAASSGSGPKGSFSAKGIVGNGVLKGSWVPG